MGYVGVWLCVGVWLRVVVHYFSVAIQFLPRVLFDHNIGYVGLSFAMQLLLHVLFDHSFGYVSLSFAISPLSVLAGELLHHKKNVPVIHAIKFVGIVYLTEVKPDALPMVRRVHNDISGLGGAPGPVGMFT
ncbi:hypothetical protein BKA57DRAFT_495945 [Linnemannia elongata]|nr:hypothetical protein BKA57DRAFT_495945 [Linnemannia elongata]